MMHYKGYVGKVEFDADAKILHGEVVGIRDVVTFQADSVKELENAFQASVDDYLAFCSERGEQPERPHSGKFVVRTDSALHRDLTRLARMKGASLNTLIVEYLSRAVAEARPRTKAASSRLPAKSRSKSKRSIRTPG